MKDITIDTRGVINIIDYIIRRQEVPIFSERSDVRKLSTPAEGGALKILTTRKLVENFSVNPLEETYIAQMILELNRMNLGYVCGKISRFFIFIR